ncbi:hypothetical protein JTE90_005828 [Oedothorax gibbosus]|uniref:Uncharacterized protein n=1 Tax=Oedothorax gibbosus TaxID=931172 RepID=A0AAV6V313_9ARAC|nr:hypothetical protein JTE90_005828 [Oedothorax gibbosus]
MNAEQVSSNPQLLYSEHINTNDTKHIVQLIERKNKEKPAMKFTKSPVLSKVLDLLPRLKQAEADLKTKDQNELNIEICDENSPAIEMNVAIPKVLQENDTELCSESSNEETFEDDENDSEVSSDENSSSSEESGEEDMLCISSQRTLPQTKNSSVQNQKLVIEYLPESEQNGLLTTSSKSCELINDVSDDPPAKKLCH